MAEKTVEVGDTELRIEETEGGFEAVEVGDEYEGTYLLVREGYSGAVVPLGGAYEIYRGQGGIFDAYLAYDPDEDISDLRDGASSGVPAYDTHDKSVGFDDDWNDNEDDEKQVTILSNPDESDVTFRDD